MTRDPETVDIDRFLDGGAVTYSGWKRALRAGVLLGQSCQACGYVTAAPKMACVRCGTDDIAPVRLSTTGTVFTETTVAVAPEPFDGPYQVALVDIDDARVMVHVDGDVEIGDEVELLGTVDEDEVAPVFG